MTEYHTRCENFPCDYACQRRGRCDWDDRPIGNQAEEESKDCIQSSDSASAVRAFRNTFAILHSVDMWELENAGIIRKGDQDKWTRFNENLTTFILKLDDAKLDALYALVQSRQPERYREVA